MGGQKRCQVKMPQILLWAFSDLFEIVDFENFWFWTFGENDAHLLKVLMTFGDVGVGM